MIDSIDLKFTSQDHYASGGIDTMTLLMAKLNTEQYTGLVIGDVDRYVLRYLVTRNTKDMEKALTMLAWGVNRLRKEAAGEGIGKENPTNIDLKFTSQDHYASGGIDTMTLLDAKLNTEQYTGLVIGDVVRYTLRYLVTHNPNDLEKALTMLAWGVNRLRKEAGGEGSNNESVAAQKAHLRVA